MQKKQSLAIAISRVQCFVVMICAYCQVGRGRNVTNRNEQTHALHSRHPSLQFAEPVSTEGLLVEP